MNIKNLIFIAIFAAVGSLSAMKYDQNNNIAYLHLAVTMKDNLGQLKIGDILSFKDRQYNVTNHVSSWIRGSRSISYKLEAERKFLNFHWATDIISYSGLRDGKNLPREFREYNYRNIVLASALFAGCVALVGFAWKNFMPAQENG